MSARRNDAMYQPLAWYEPQEVETPAKRAWLFSAMRRLIAIPSSMNDPPAWHRVNSELFRRDIFPVNAWTATAVAMPLVERICVAIRDSFNRPNHHFLPDDSFRCLACTADGMLDTIYLAGYLDDLVNRLGAIPKLQAMYRSDAKLIELVQYYSKADSKRDYNA
jgi:hypothetical protein